MVTRRLPNDSRSTTASVIAKGQRKARGQRDAAATVKTLRQGGRQFEELSDVDSSDLLKEALSVKNEKTGKTAYSQAEADSGEKKKPNWKQLNAKLDKTLAKAKFKAAPAKAGIEKLYNSEDMSEENLGKLRIALGNYNGAKVGSTTRETHRKQVHSLLRSGGQPQLTTSLRIPCAVPKCTGSGALHPTSGNKTNAPDATEYRCNAHVNDYDTKDVWDQLGESEAKKTANQAARNAKSYEKKKTNAATISTELPKD
jgi:hypothetical protein